MLRGSTAPAEAHHGSAPEGVQSVPGVYGLGGTPDPPDTGPVHRFGPANLDLAVHQGKVVDQLDSGSGGQGIRVVSPHGVGGDQGQCSLEMERRPAFPGSALLVHPAEVVTEHVVQESLAALKDFPQFLFQRLPVFGVLGNHLK